ncbi:MAG: methionyl-tRNA formyltransferase [bacterium]|nr:methionyl-tRNA formyltransferase [bacterium]
MSGAPLRLVFLGTPEFAVASLRALAGSRHELVGAISQPDRPRGRGRKSAATPVKQTAEELGIPVLQPEKVGAPEVVEWLAALQPDVAVVVAFGQFIPKRVRELPRLEMINGHASLLPRWRGAAPIQWAIAGGDASTGISVMRVVKEMDAGDVCLMRETPIGADETAGELSERLSLLAAEALLEGIEQIATGAAEFAPQDPALVTEAPKIDREFARVDWGWSAERVLRRIRAASPRPGVDVKLALSGKTFRILKASPVKTGDGPTVVPGTVIPGAVRAHGQCLRVGALDEWVDVLRLQVQGRRPVEAAEFLRGTAVSEEERVEPPPGAEASSSNHPVEN